MDMLDLLSIMKRLRDPDRGCPWDKVQTFASIAPYTIEEAYEVVDAIEREDYAELKSELGDLLLQVVYHAQIAEEKALFDFQQVLAEICQKLMRRHPHVFADVSLDTEDQVKTSWEELKAKERADKQQQGVLDGVPLNLPALRRAHKLQKRAARVGFDWDTLAPVLEKVREELSEVEQELSSGDTQALESELGDLLFSCVNLTRSLGLNAEETLRKSNQKFERRFRQVEEQVRQAGKQLSDCTLAELDMFWERVKQAESNGYR